MPLPVSITPTTDVCSLAENWLIAPELATRLVQLSSRLEFGFSIISGYRTPARQDELRAQGRPTADNDRSTHLSCPATGADVRLNVEAVQSVKLRLGAEARLVGLRWGGGSTPDANGIPSDWNHLDLGPRKR